MNLNLYIFSVCSLFIVWILAIVDARQVWIKVVILVTGMIAMLVWLSSLAVTFQGAIS